MVVVQLEKSISLSLGGRSTLVVLQGLETCSMGISVAGRGNLSFQDGETCGIADEGVWMEW